MSLIRLAEQAQPATPSTGKIYLYAKTDGKPYSMDDAGTEYDLTGGGGGGSGTMNTVKADGVQVGGADITTLDFSTKFTITESPDKEINITVDDTQIVHDSLSGFVANEHINHTAVSVLAGTGLSGGGTIAENRTLAVDIASLNTVTPAVGDFLMFADINDSNAIRKTTLTALAPFIDHDTLLNFASNEHFTQGAITQVGTVATGTWEANIITGTYGGTGVNNGSRTITTGGNITTAGAFVTAGAYSLTLTSTDTTNVTLPTTGTLATRAGIETFTNKTLQSATLDTSLVLKQTTGNYTISWTDPAAARAYSIPDAGGSASFVMTAGAQTINGIKTFGSLPECSTSPTTANQFVNKTYADTIAGGIKMRDSVRGKTAVALPACAYDNGTDGVGATLTANADGSINDTGVGGLTDWALNERVLVDKQATGSQNGIYKFTQIGDVSNPWILTRVTDFDEADADEIVANATVQINAGTYINQKWSLVTTGTITVGTTTLTFGLYDAPTSYTGGNGINITGTEIMVDVKANGGLTFDAGKLYVEADGTSIELNGSGFLALVTNGVNDTHIDFGTGANQVSLVDVPDDTSFSKIQTADVTSNRITKLGTIADQVYINYANTHGEDGDEGYASLKIRNDDSEQNAYWLSVYDSTNTLRLSSNFLGDFYTTGLTTFTNDEADEEIEEVTVIGIEATNVGSLGFVGSKRSALYLRNAGADAEDYFLLCRKAATGAFDAWVKNTGASYFGGNMGIGAGTVDERLHVEDSTLNSAPAIKLENDAQAFKWVVDGADSDTLKLIDVTDTNASVYEVTLGTQDIAFTGNIDVASTKNITYAGSNPYKTLELHGRSITSPTTSGCATPTQVEIGTGITNYTNEYLAYFDPDTNEYGEWAITMPNEYSGGDIYVKVEWVNSTTNEGNVVWQIQARGVPAGSSLSGTWTTTTSLTASASTGQNFRNVTAESAAITPDGTPAGGNEMRFRIIRNAAIAGDTLAADAAPTRVYVRYPVDSISS